MLKQLFLRWLAVTISLAGIIGAAPALAEQVVIQRNVTVREGPSRRTGILTFPAVGSQLELLDEGARSAGYYHVRLPDGRDGWVYYTFVRRVPEDGPGDAVAAEGAVARVHYIDVDQGAATLLEFSCAAILIDAGGRGAAANAHLIAYLDAFFERRSDLQQRLAAVYITHAHFDHDANLNRVAQRFSIGGFVYNGQTDGRIDDMLEHARSTTAPIPHRAITDAELEATGRRGYSDDIVDPVNCGDVDPRIRILSGGVVGNPGWTSAELRNPNNHSLVIRIDYGNASFLFTGDLETPGIERLVRRYGGSRTLDVDVFAVGHHGAENGTTASMLRAMTPEIAVIPVGLPNTVNVQMSAWDHGHPRQAMLTALAASITRQRVPSVQIATFAAQEGEPALHWVSDAIYASSRDGDIVISASPSGTLIVNVSR